MQINNICIVCTGNICRSPFVEAVLRNKMPAKNFQSAGTKAVTGSTADPSMIEFSDQLGINLHSHKSSPVTREGLSSSELILVMEEYHLDAIRSTWPEASGKTMLLGKWDNNVEIFDPYRQSSRFYKLIVDQMLEQADRWIPRLTTNE